MSSLSGLIASSIDEIYRQSLTDGFIRLLELEPGNAEDPLVFNLGHASLVEAEDTYEAISYVWGDPTDLHPILCDGFEHRITVSLASALRAFRHSTQRMRLWADAICINQNDPEEKASQVKQMQKVYQNAIRVLVYLGPDTDDIATDCFCLIKEFNQFWGDQLRHFGGVNKVPNNPLHPSHADVGRWQCTKSLFSLPWFDRLWIIQEAGLAKDCRVQWGRATCEFVEIMELVLWFHCRPDIAQFARSAITLKWSNIFLKAQCMVGNDRTWRRKLPVCQWVNDCLAPSPENRSFIDLLRTGRLVNTSDARDHIYCFLSSPLAALGDGQVLVEVDYSKSLEDICFTTANALLRHPRERAFLFAGVDHESARHVTCSDGWPSWVPRWHLGHHTTPLAVPFNWYCAGGSSSFEAHVNADKSLSLPCVIFDELAWVSDVLFDGCLGVDSTKWSQEHRAQKTPPFENLRTQVLETALSSTEDVDHMLAVTLCREYPSSVSVRTKGIQKSFLRDDFSAYRKALRKEAAAISDCPSIPSVHRSKRAVSLARKLSECHNRKLTITQNKRIALAPRFAKEGDACCIFPGIPVPFVLRKAKRANEYYLVGDSYVYGAMRGEVLEELRRGMQQLETITII
ncbi:heterokaryon incompatibility protein-domain-containing protein [Stachybotrys elegans]|uniref:Heterokaryon incompatibility protein-domain-containing protein n=1 Tax=Stachybotrys elegans TaxID=80388 RepID=A0A8K0WL02_9HYPO|nr:heterokaryon incompatibility protein-domain-containing protein [Stachybotrys elegans]